MRTCHRRGAHAMGGMAALIPSRKDPEANERAIAARPGRQGARGDRRLRRHVGRAPRHRRRPRARSSTPCSATGRTRSTAGATTSTVDRRRPPRRRGDAGRDHRGRACATTSRVGFQYLSFWLGGRGAAAINNLMEDAATAEISRSQLWQWIRHGASLEDGPTVTRDLVRDVLDEEMARIHAEVGDEVWAAGRPGRHPRGVRARRAGRGLPRVPDPGRLRQDRLTSPAARRPGRRAPVRRASPTAAC